MNDKQREELREVFHSGNTHAAKRTMLDMSADVRMRFIEAKRNLSQEDYSAFLFIVSCLLEEARNDFPTSDITKKLDDILKDKIDIKISKCKASSCYGDMIGRVR